MDMLGTGMMLAGIPLFFVIKKNGRNP